MKNIKMNNLVMFIMIMSLSLQVGFRRNRRHRLKVGKKMTPVQIHKPLQDNRQFYRLEFENQLEVLMIQSVDIEYSQAVLAVNVGSYNNPSNIPGLAHYLEHLGKFGSKSMNNPTIYPECVSKYQGSRNAMTSGKETYYYFKLSKTGLTECLNLLIGFFIDPNFDKEASLKEIDAVESEYQNNMGVRMESYAFTKLIKNKYPQNKFSVGNKKSLFHDVQQSGLNTIDELHKFFNTYYSANLIKLVIESPLNPDQYLGSIQNNLSQIKNLNVNRNTLFSQQQLFRPKQYLIKYISNLETPRLSIFFEIPDPMSQYHSKSLTYILNLFNSPHPNSLYSNLINKQLIIKFTANEYVQITNTAIIQFKFELTEKGYEQMHDIIDMFYDYSDYLKREGIQYWIYQQMMNYNRVSFQYSQMNTDIIGLVANLFYYDISDILQQPYQYENYDPNQIKHYLQLINKDKAQYCLGNSKFVLQNSKSKSNDYHELKSHSIYHHNILMNLKYQLIKNPFEEVNIGNNYFEVPKKNHYIPESIKTIETIESDQQDPICKNNCHKREQQIVNEFPQLMTNGSVRTWHLKVMKFQMPQQQIGFNFIVPTSSICLKNNTLNTILVQHLKDVYQYQFYELPEEIYSISFKQSIQSIQIVFIGDHEKLKIIIKEYLQTVIKTINKEQYESLKQRLIDNLIQKDKQKLGAYYSAMSGLKYNLFNTYFRDRQILKQVEQTNHLDFLKHLNTFFGQSSLETLCVGYICECECQDVVKQVNDMQKQQMDGSDGWNDNSKPVFNEVTRQQVRNIEDYELELILRNQNSYDNNHVLLQYKQFGIQDLRMKVITEIISSQLYVRAFQYLRTNKQLGYKIAASPLKMGKVYGYVVGIQGTVYDVETYHQEIQTFWTMFDQYMDQLHPNHFQQIKESYLSKNRQGFQELPELFQYFWEQIEEQSYDFGIKNKIDQIGNELDLQSVKQFYKSYFFKNEFVVKLKTQSEYGEEDGILHNQYKNILQGLNLLN